MTMLVDVRHCDLCGGNQFALELRVESWQLMRCTNCGLVCTSPRYGREALAKLYSSEYYQNAPAYYQSLLSPPSADELKLARDADRILKCAGRRSLDVGCGTGRLVEAFQRAGFQALGIDPNETVVEAGRSYGRNIAAKNLSDVSTGSQDCITASHVLEHTYSPREFLTHCHRILDDLGQLIIEVPNYACGAARQLKEDWQPLYPDTHLYQFTPTTLARYLNDIGFEVISMQRVGGRGFLHAPVPKPVRESQPIAPRHAPTSVGSVREAIWNSRRLLYRLPFAREIIRYCFWQVLRQGEFIRIRAAKTNYITHLEK
jgi:2-polyprenyl-3-methyl-5-hydroxy-6-metoxy-1,4-benzoquinol methylase